MPQSPKYKYEEKAEIVKKICDLYESQDATIESCCKSCGISDRVFRYWLVEHSEFSELYKKARMNQDEFYWEHVIRPKAKKSLSRLIDGEEYEEIRVETGEAPMGPIDKKSITKKVVLPNPTAVIFAMKGEYKQRFAERQEITDTDGNSIQPAIIQIKYPSEPPKDE